jgi:CheY-like chemotaxis protein
MAKTLLLADDSVTIQKVVGITFANEDVELVTVDNGDDALIRARQLKPDLVLADIGMPGLDGYALCAAIRNEPSIAHTPVLLLTGTFETYDDERALEVGANGYISKPFEAQALVDRVFAMLAEGKAPERVVAPQPTPEPARASTTPIAIPSPIPTPAPAAPVRRLELPPVPGAISSRPARTVTPRPAEPFEFDVTPEPEPALEAVAEAEPLWEAEPELEAIDDSPIRRAILEAEPIAPPTPALSEPPADATRLFSPDLLGRSARLPEIPEPPIAPSAAPVQPRGDFSFEDLDFEEPTGSPANQSQIFGESSDEFSSETILAAPPAPEFSDEIDPQAPLADPLYSATRFLDPQSDDDSAPSFGTPNPAAAPPLPDLLGSEDITAPSRGFDELELSDVEPEPEIEGEPLDEADSFDESFATYAATPEPPRALAATRLMVQEEASDAVADELDDLDELEPELLEPEPMAAEPDFEPEPAPAPQMLAEITLPRAISIERAPMTAPVIDSALLSQTLEKVAWEAFGSLSEQVVNEVRKRVEAVVWEVVPQLCERLIREEIARLKADLPE